MKNQTFIRALGLCLLVSDGAFAQDQPVSGITGSKALGKSRIEIGLAYAQTLGSLSFTTTQTIRENVEDGTLSSAYKVGSAPGAGFHIQYNLNEKFGIRLGAQTSSRKSDGTFSGQSPHPFFFNRPRPFSGVQNGLSFSEAAYTLSAVLRKNHGKWLVNLEGGPAYFTVNATLADKVQLTDTYPHDAVTFSGVSSSKKKTSPIGFAIGAEVGRELSSAIAVVAQGRFITGTGSVSLGTTKVDVKAGGAQARIGIRIIAARRK